MPTKLTGNPSLAYMGVNAPQPPNIACYKRAPTVNDWQNFIVGDIWINITPTPATSREVYMLVALLRNQATWVFLYDGTGGNVLTSLIDDSGNIVTPLAGSITIKGGANINTDGSVPHIIKVNLNTSIWQPATTADQSKGVYSLGGIPFLHSYTATSLPNLFLGEHSGNFTLTFDSNVCVGDSTGRYLTSGFGNSLFGHSAGISLDTGSANCIFGSNAGTHLTDGQCNVLIGDAAGDIYDAGCNSNIVIGYQSRGISGQSNTLYIGNGTGTGNGNLANDYIAGIYKTASGVAYLGTSPKMVAIGSDDKITSSPNLYIPTTLPDVGQLIQNGLTMFSTLGYQNLFVGLAGNLSFDYLNGPSWNSDNVAVGWLALNGLAGTSAGDGLGNACLGVRSAAYVSTGSYNTCIGFQAGFNSTGHGITTGSNNTLIGYWAGKYYTGAESWNILIGSGVVGTLGASNECWIGYGTGSGAHQLNKTYIAGIQTIAVTGTPVLVSNIDQLGVSASSIKYKKDVVDMKDMSDIISKLRPVEFRYKTDDKQLNYGLVAEEVEPIWPEMVAYDKDGNISTLYYQFLAPILLKEIQSLRKRIEELEKK